MNFDFWRLQMSSEPSQMPYGVRDVLCDMGYEETIVFDNPEYDEAIVGVSDEGRTVYDYERMVQILMLRDGMDEEEATDFVSYNTMRAAPYAGEFAPIIMYPVENPDAERFFKELKSNA